LCVFVSVCVDKGGKRGCVCVCNKRVRMKIRW